MLDIFSERRKEANRQQPDQDKANSQKKDERDPIINEKSIQDDENTNNGRNIDEIKCVLLVWFQDSFEADFSAVC